MIGFLVYLPTLFFASEKYYAATVLAAIIYWLNHLKSIKISKQELVFIFIAVFLPCLNWLCTEHYVSPLSKSILGELPYIPFLVFSFITSKTLGKRDVDIISAIFIVEVVFAILEFSTGVRSFFTYSFNGVSEFGENESMYSNRVYGLSLLVSVFGIKALFVPILYLTYRVRNTDTRWLRKVFDVAVILSGIVGLVLSFSRSGMFSALAFVCLFLFIKGFGTNKLKIRLFSLVTLMFIVIGIGALWEDIAPIFFRGQQTVDLSGRNYVYPLFFEFLNGHFWAGNGSVKLWIELNGALYHAHNSLIELVASNGSFVSIAFLISLVKMVPITKTSIIFILPLLIYCMGQYGIWWGFSFSDILFFKILMACSEDGDEKQF